MESAAPSVVAVVVTRDPGPWFEQTLSALAAQDYSELSVLVLDAGSDEDPTPRVARVLPQAFVGRLGANKGFAASANAVLDMVEGASYYLLCHDDVAPDPDAVHLLVEESFRSNAGVVAPKIVDFEDPSRLLHVGMAVDKGGAVVDRVEPGEIDHGQHDAVQDVFLAPGGCTLVRADLFAELGGFDPDVVAMGEDLDLSWRAQVAGARVVVAPAAVVRHGERLASGRRELDGLAPGVQRRHERRLRGGKARPRTSGSRPVAGATAVQRFQSMRDDPNRAELYALQRRHELRAVLKCYGPFHLWRVVPQLVVLSAAEVTVAMVTGHRSRARAVIHSWRWNFSCRKELRARRAELKSHRRLPDSEVRRLQLHGSARLSGFLRRAFTYGMQAAHLGRAHDAALGELSDAAALRPQGEVSSPDALGPAWANAEVVVLDDVGTPRAKDFSTTTRVALWVGVAVVLLFGSRQLLDAGFPAVGQLVPFPSAGTMFDRFFSGWQPTGLGIAGPTTIGLGILGAAGTVLLGAVGFLQKVAVLGCVPLGAWGMSRLLRSFGSRRARTVATIGYLALPLPYDALATGKWDGLVAYAFTPWVISATARAMRLEPFSDDEHRAGLHGALRHASLLRMALALGIGESLAAAFAPSSVLVVMVVAVGLALGALVVQGPSAWRAALRACAMAVGATAVTALLLWPWTGSVLGGPGRWVTMTGPAALPSESPGWSHLLSFAVGPIGDSVLAFGFLATALLPLLIGGRWRLAWAGRAWVLALVSWVLVWAGGRGWTGPVAMPPQVVLVPAGAALVLAIALGVCAFESDLSSYRFGWRQGICVLAAAAAVVAAIPVVAASTSGRWKLPASGYGETTMWMARASGGSGFRVLWLANPKVLPGGGWQVSPGLGYELTEGPLPDVTNVWSGSSPGAASAVARDVQLARNDSTVRLGQLLAPYSIRYVAVVSNLGPVIPGEQTPLAASPPQDLVPGLGRQIDLRQLLAQGGIDVYANDAPPIRAVATAGAAPSSTPASATSRSGAARWTPVLPGASGSTSFSGRVPAGTLVASVAPASDWKLTSNGKTLASAPAASNFPARYRVGRPGRVTLQFQGSPAHAIEVWVEVVLWVVALGLLWGWWGRAVRRFGWRRRRRARSGRRDGGLVAVEPQAPDTSASPLPVGVGESL